MEHSLRVQSTVYGDLLAQSCPAPTAWIEAYRKQGIPVEFDEYSAQRHGTFVGSDMSMVRSVLERHDRAADKFGNVLGWFDENGCLVNL